MEVRTGTPPWKLKVEPPLVALTGTLATLLPIELVRNEMTVPLLATAAGTKWLPWMRTDSGLFGSPVPPRKSGSSPVAEDEEVGELVPQVLPVNGRGTKQDQRCRQQN